MMALIGGVSNKHHRDFRPAIYPTPRMSIREGALLSPWRNYVDMARVHVHYDP